MSIYYTVGARAALSHVGVLAKFASGLPSLEATKGVLHDLGKPVLTGATLGGLAGAAAADDNHRAQGMLAGASMGGLGAGLGTVAGKGINAYRMHGPESAFASGLKNSMPEAEHAAARAVSPEFAQMALNDRAGSFARSPEGQKLWGAVEEAKAQSPMHEQGAAMLGGTLGTLGGIAKTPRDPQPQQAPGAPRAMSQFEDPYRYSLEGFPGQ